MTFSSSLPLPRLPRSKEEVKRHLTTAARHIKDHFIPHERNQFRPLALRHRSLWLMSALLIMVKLTILALLSYGTPVPVFSSAITTDNILTLTNQSRHDSGIGDLTLNNQLAQAAQAKAADMLAKQYFAHTTPDEHSPWDFITATGYKFQAAGENLAVNFQQAEEVEQAWMNSSGHRANILNGTFQEIGIGIATGQFEGSAVTLVVQMFGKPIPTVKAASAPSAITPAPTPAPVVTPQTPPPAKPAPVKPAPVKPEAKPAPKPVVKPAPKPVVSPTAAPAPQSQPAPPTPKPIPLQISLRGPSVIPEVVHAAEAAGVSIANATAVLAGSDVRLSVETEGSVKTVVVTSGDKTFDLNLIDNLWQGTLPLAALLGQPLVVTATDTTGHTVNNEMASFAQNVQQNYSPLSQSLDNIVNFIGFHLNPHQWEQAFYSLFIAALLFALMLTVVIRPRLQYVSMVAHTSVVVLLATLLLMSA